MNAPLSASFLLAAATLALAPAAIGAPATAPATPAPATPATTPAKTAAAPTAKPATSATVAKPAAATTAKPAALPASTSAAKPAAAKPSAAPATAGATGAGAAGDDDDDDDLGDVVIVDAAPAAGSASQPAARQPAGVRPTTGTTGGAQTPATGGRRGFRGGNRFGAPAGANATPFGPAGADGSISRPGGGGIIRPGDPRGAGRNQRFGGAAAAALPAAPLKPEDIVGPVILVDESLPQVISLYEKFTGKTVLRTQTLPILKINFNGQDTLTRRDAVVALESLLSINGVAIIPLAESGFYKALPTAEASREAPPLYTESVASLPPSERVISRLFLLNNTSVQVLDPLLRQFISTARGGSMQSFLNANALLFTGSIHQVQQVERLVANLDNSSKFLFFKLKNIRASDVKKQLQTLAGAIAYSFAGGITVEADDLANHLIIVTPPRNEKALRDIIAQMDVKSVPDTVSESIGLKHTDVQSVFRTLESVVTGKAQTGSGTSGSTSAMRSNVSGGGSLTGGVSTTVNSYGTYSFTNRVVSTSGGQRASTPNAATPVVNAETPNSFSEHVTVTADERTNRLLIFGTASDLKQIKELVAKLDVPLAQVRIEAVIVEVTLKNGEASGLDSLGIGIGTLPRSGDSVSAGSSYTLGEGTGSRYGYNNPTWRANSSSPTNPLTGGAPFSTNFTIAPDGFDLSLVLRAAESNSRVRVLSAPLINTSHNQAASVFVGETRPSITGTTNYNLGGGTQATIENRKFGLQLAVTPRVGSDGSVEMKIEQTSNNVSGTTVIDGNEQWITAERSAASYLRARDNETIVLAGLQSYQETKSHGVMWLLGYIPLIGRFFQPETEETSRTELIIFLKPHVIDAEKDRAPSDTTPGLFPGSLTRADAKSYLDTGRFSAVSLTEAEREALEEIRRRQNQQAYESRRYQLEQERVEQQRREAARKRAGARPTTTGGAATTGTTTGTTGGTGAPQPAK